MKHQVIPPESTPREPLQRVFNGRRIRWVGFVVALLAGIYTAAIIVLSRVTAMEILRHRRWGLDERWPGVPFASPSGHSADFPAAVCQTPHGLRVVGPPLGRTEDAQLGSLRVGDLIRFLDGVPATPTFADRMADRLRSAPAGSTVVISLSRMSDGELHHIETIATLPPAVLTPSDPGLPYEVIALETAPGVYVRGWYVPPPSRGARRAPALLYVHGRQRNRRHIGLTDLTLPSHARGYGLLLIDLLGSGASDGATDFWRDDEIQHALRFLRARPEIDGARIGVVGVSFGGIKALQAAGDPGHHVGALAIIAPADTTPSFVRLIVPPTELPAFIRRRLIRGMTLPLWLVESGRPAVNWWFRRATGRCLSEVAPVRAAAAVRCPVFFAHGTADRTFPLRSARRIFAAIPTQKVFYAVEGHDHFTTAQSGEPLWRNLFAFLAEYLVSPSVGIVARDSTARPLNGVVPRTRVIAEPVASPRFVDVPAAD